MSSGPTGPTHFCFQPVSSVASIFYSSISLFMACFPFLSVHPLPNLLPHPNYSSLEIQILSLPCFSFSKPCHLADLQISLDCKLTEGRD